MTLKVNSPAPDFTLQTVDGRQVALSNALNSGNVLLVFLRHLG